MDTSQPSPPPLPSDYVRRVNRAIDYILENLDRPVDLNAVAGAAGLSPSHFHRIFKALQGETIHAFTSRVRLERALRLMSHAPAKPLADIAAACGFGSASDFSRTFKKRFGIPPSAFDIATFRRDRRAEWEANVADPEHAYLLEGLPPGENPDGFVASIRELPERHVAYARVKDPYRPHVVMDAADRMESWAETQGLADNQWLGYMWEDPEVVDHTLCRYDVALVAPGFTPKGPYGAYTFPPMLVAQIDIRGPIDLEVRALDWLYKTWLPTSGYLPASQPGFEAWHGRPFAHGNEHFELSLQLPIQDARSGL